MAIELIGLEVITAIIHELPRQEAGGAKPEPVLSTTESPLDDALRLFFRDKISVAAGGRESYEAVFLGEGDLPVATQLGAWFDGDVDFVAMSQRCAEHLWTVQTAVQSAGLLAFVETRHGLTHGVAILKLEHDQGVRLRRAHDANGHETLQLEHVRELLLSSKVRLFKQAYISPHEDGSLHLHVVDSQRPQNATQAIAQFFLTAFLGARLMIDSRVATRDWLDGVTEWINEELGDTADAQERAIDLVSYLRAQSPVVSTQEFAAQYLPDDRAVDFNEYMANRGLPTTNIPKDTELIRNRLARIQLIGDSGIKVIGPSDQFKSHVVTTPLPGGRAAVTVTDHFKRVDP